MFLLFTNQIYRHWRNAIGAGEGGMMELEKRNSSANKESTNWRAKTTASPGGKTNQRESGERRGEGRAATQTLQSWYILKIQLLMTPMYLSHTTWCLRRGRRAETERQRTVSKWSKEVLYSLMTHCNCEIWVKKSKCGNLCTLSVMGGGSFLWISLC